MTLHAHDDRSRSSLRQKYKAGMHNRTVPSLHGLSIIRFQIVNRFGMNSVNSMNKQHINCVCKEVHRRHDNLFNKLTTFLCCYFLVSTAVENFMNPH